MPKGNLAQINNKGQLILDNILAHPYSKTSIWNHRNFGNIIDIEIPKQGGARFTKTGEFIGFLEP